VEAQVVQIDAREQQSVDAQAAQIDAREENITKMKVQPFTKC
jgi:hypothetical protein